MSERYPEFPAGTRSVTEILHDVGLVDDRWFNDAARDRGLRIHCGAQLLAQGILDWESVEPVDLGYLKSCELLLRYTGWTARLTEQRRLNTELKVCGTYDVSFDAPNRDSCVLADYKTGAPQPWHEIQLGFYYKLNGEKGKLAGIYLQEDGSTAKVKFYNAHDAWRKAQVVLNFYRLKEQYGK